MLYPVGIHCTVPVPEAAASFLRDVFDFECIAQDDGSWLVKNDALTLVLQAGIASSVALQLHSSNMQQDSAYLSNQPQIHVIDATIQQHGALCWQNFHTDCGLRLCLSRTLNEDELMVLPPLPNNLPWDKATDRLVRCVLCIVPVDFRHQARQRVTERAEFLCLQRGALLVSESDAIESLKDVTLDFQQRELYETLQQQGVDVARYFQGSSKTW